MLPVDVEVLAVQPHAHNLARTMEAAATLPDGSARRLIAIKDWDFRWQDVYRYARSFTLPKGTTISMRFTYDNSADNPRNPSRPPRAVVWGQNTTDEMGDLWIQVVPRSAADLMTLNEDISRKTRAEDLAAYTRVLNADPLNPLRHDAVALLNLQQGRVAEAEAEFRQSLRLNPDSASTHYNLGLAFSAQRKYREAAEEFQNALRLDPGHADAHNNLGAMLHLFGQLEQAATEYRRAFELKPESSEPHNNLGRLLAGQGQFAEAAREFDRALTLKPDAVAALSGLALVRATASDPAVRRPAEPFASRSKPRISAGGRIPRFWTCWRHPMRRRGSSTGRSKPRETRSAWLTPSACRRLSVEIRERLKRYELRNP